MSRTEPVLFALGHFFLVELGTHRVGARFLEPVVLEALGLRPGLVHPRLAHGGVRHAVLQRIESDESGARGRVRRRV